MSVTLLKNRRSGLGGKAKNRRVEKKSVFGRSRFRGCTEKKEWVVKDLCFKSLFREKINKCRFN